MVLGLKLESRAERNLLLLTASLTSMLLGGLAIVKDATETVAASSTADVVLLTNHRARARVSIQ